MIKLVKTKAELGRLASLCCCYPWVSIHSINSSYLGVYYVMCVVFYDCESLYWKGIEPLSSEKAACALTTTIYVVPNESYFKFICRHKILYINKISCSISIKKKSGWIYDSENISLLMKKRFKDYFSSSFWNMWRYY